MISFCIISAKFVKDIPVLSTTQEDEANWYSETGIWKIE